MLKFGGVCFFCFTVVFFFFFLVSFFCFGVKLPGVKMDMWASPESIMSSVTGLGDIYSLHARFAHFLTLVQVTGLYFLRNWRGGGSAFWTIWYSSFFECFFSSQEGCPWEWWGMCPCTPLGLNRSEILSYFNWYLLHNYLSNASVENTVFQQSVSAFFACLCTCHDV